MGKRDIGSRQNSSGQVQQHRRRSAPHTNVLSKDGSLEIISEESFLQRKSGITSSCTDCQKERFKECKKSKKRKKREIPTKLNSPIVVRLTDTIKVSVKGKLRQSPKSSDMESACSTDSEDGTVLDLSSKNNLSTNSTTVSKPHDLRTKAIQGNMRLKAQQDINEFLTAIEKDHQKGHGTFAKYGKQYNSNLLSESNVCHQGKYKGVLDPPRSSLLNNFRDYHYGNHNSSYLPRSPKGLKFMDLNKNVRFVQNDLQGKGSLEKQDSLEECESASVTSVSTECHSDIESSSSSSAESNEELTNGELKHLSSYTSGAPIMRYECPPHECPECLTAYYKYARSRDQVKDMFTVEVLENQQQQKSGWLSSVATKKKEIKQVKNIKTGNRSDSVSSQASTTPLSSCNESEHEENEEYCVTVTSQNTVEVSIANFHLSSDSDVSTAGLISKELLQHDTSIKNVGKVKSCRRKGSTKNNSYRYSNNNKIYNKYCGNNKYHLSSSSFVAPTGEESCSAVNQLDTISADLTDSQITFTVEYHSQEVKHQTPTTNRSYHSQNSQRTAAHPNVCNVGSSSFMDSFTFVSSSPYHSSSPLQQHLNHQMDLSQDIFHYNFYNTMVGYFPYAVPYYLTPPYYYMCPVVMSIPRPLVVPRDLECLASQRLCLIPASEIKQCK